MAAINEYTYELKIPKNRVAVLIGTKGEIKKRIESEAHVKLEIDSNEGDVFATGRDALSLLAAREIVRAIGRGFNPDVALSLLKPDFAFEIVSLTDFAKTKNDEIRLKGRVIGKEGKSRRVIEELSATDMCVFGKTIGIIGFADNVSIARQAIISLLQGSTHANVYKWLEKQRRNLSVGALVDVQLPKDTGKDIVEEEDRDDE